MEKKATMQVRSLDTTGLICPQPILKLSVLSPDMKAGELLDVIADCPTFEKDVRAWCSRLRKTLIFVREECGYTKTARILF
jgi:tRNA 2-thiouridine synthesizing protein A